MSRWVAVFALSALFVSSVGAQDSGRTLNGYEFIPSRLVEDPFPTSHFGTTTGGGVAFDLKTPFIIPGVDTLRTLVGDVAFLALSFRYQQQVKDWIAARFSLKSTGRLGVDEQSVLAQGVTGSFVLNLGTTMRIHQTEAVIVSGAVDFSRTDLIGLDPFGFARKILEEGLGAEDNSLVDTGDAISAVAGARVGWAPESWLGITGVLDLGWGDVTDSSGQTLVGGGLLLGVDLKNRGWVPLGFQLIGATDAFTQGGADLASRSWSYGFGLFYTGWEDFSIGFETTRSRYERRDTGDTFEGNIATFNIRYWP